MGIGPSTKETSLHHFRDPLLDVISSDEELDLLGIIIVGTPDNQEEKMLVGTRAAVLAESMRADGAIISADGGLCQYGGAIDKERNCCLWIEICWDFRRFCCGEPESECNRRY